MLRFLLVAAATTILPTLAHADPGALTPMTEVADTTALCKQLGDGNATATCAPISKLAVKGIGEVEVWSAEDRGMILGYAVSIRDGGKRWLSDRIDVPPPSNCGMMKCDIVDSYKPRAPRVLKTSSPSVAVEVPIESHHEHTADDGKKGWQVIDERWSEMSIVVCGKIKGVPTCSTQSYGAKNNSCKVKLADNGTITAACNTTSYVPF